MTDSVPLIVGQRRIRPRRLVVAATLFAAVALILIAIVILTGSRQLQPDEIVHDYGTYLSPGRRFQVVVNETENDTVRVELESPSEWKRILSRFRRRDRRSRPPEAEFEVERDWFLCFDEYDRLWIFVGQWDREWGPLRTLPGGGTRPYAPAVQMSGFSFLGTRPIRCHNVVTATGDWAGVPPGFFKLIPGKENASKVLWGSIPPIPTAPPEFTPAQRAAARSVWR